MAVATAIPQAPSDDKRWRIVETRMRRLGNRPDALIEALHSAQEAFGYLDTDALRVRRRGRLGVPLTKVFGVATFYHYLHAQAAGRAHLRGVHRHRLLHQRGGEILAAVDRARARCAARGDDGRRQALAADGPLPGLVQPGARRDRRRRGPGRLDAPRSSWQRLEAL